MDDRDNKPVEEVSVFAQCVCAAILTGLGLLLWKFFPSVIGALIVLAFCWITFKAFIGLLAILGSIFSGKW